MNAKAYLLAIAIVLLHPCVGQAQPGSPEVHSVTFPGVEVPPQGPASGFLIMFRPGPGNAYTHPIVRSVVAGSAADAAGLKVGDVIVAVDGRDMRYEQLFPVEVAGTRYVMLVRRGEEELELVYTYPRKQQSTQQDTSTAASRN